MATSAYTNKIESPLLWAAQEANYLEKKKIVLKTQCHC